MGQGNVGSCTESKGQWEVTVYIRTHNFLGRQRNTEDSAHESLAQESRDQVPNDISTE